MNRKADHIDERNYAAEAEDLIKGLKTSQLYKLFEIVIKEQKRAASEERHKELKAVFEVIKRHPNVDPGRIMRLERGYGPMASQARAKDGNTIKYGKKA